MGNPRGAYRYPVRSNLGRYECWLLELYGSARFKRDVYTIEDFFDFYGKKKYLTQFKAEDIDDWAVFQKSKGLNPITISIRLSRVKHFWTWCRETKGYHLPRIFEPTQRRINRQRPPAKKKAFNSVEELKAIFQATDDVELRNYIIGSLAGTYTGRASKRCVKRFRKAALKVGLDFVLGDLHRSIPKLRSWILQNFHQQFSDALFSEAKFDGGSKAAVQVSSLNVGTPVIHTSDNNVSVVGVN